MDISEKIDLFMEENNIPSLHKFSAASKIPYMTLFDIYKKKTAENSRFSTVKKLCDYMNCTIDYIAYDEVTDKNYAKGIDPRKQTRKK